MVIFLSLGIRRNGWQIAEVIIFAAVGDGFEILCISPVGDADTGDLALFCHVYCLLFLYNGIIGKLIPGDPAALFDTHAKIEYQQAHYREYKCQHMCAKLNSVKSAEYEE